MKSIGHRIQIFY